MPLTRRTLLSALAGAAVLGGAGSALALTEDDARAHISATVDDLLKVLRTANGAPVGVPELREIMVQRANLPLIARFCAGRSWRDMNDGQQDRYVEAFIHYISVTYARRFNDFAGTPNITIGRTIDAGRKGMLVESPIAMPDGKRYAVEWLVSDRGGKVEIVDLVIEQVSLAATQREEIGAMLDKRGGDVDALIQALSETG